MTNDNESRQVTNRAAPIRDDQRFSNPLLHNRLLQLVPIASGYYIPVLGEPGGLEI